MAGKVSVKTNKSAQTDSKSAETDKLKVTAGTETQSDTENKSDNAKEEPENKDEIKEKKGHSKQAESAETDKLKVTAGADIGNAEIGGGTVVCKYIGSGIWQDGNGDKWGDDFMNIKRTRQYTADEYRRREDLKFMVSYGSMEISVVEK